MPLVTCTHYTVGTTDMDDTVPYTEEELAVLYPNPQLDANKQFIDQFIKV